MLVYCDIDGCICDIREEGKKYLSSKPKDWKTYFSLIPQNKTIPHMVELVQNLLRCKNKVVFITGRPLTARMDTEAWLRKHVTPDPTLIVKTPEYQAVTTKRFKLQNILKHQPDLVIEDEPEAVELFRNAGFVVLQVHGYRWSSNSDATPPVMKQTSTCCGVRVNNDYSDPEFPVPVCSGCGKQCLVKCEPI